MKSQPLPHAAERAAIAALEACGGNCTECQSLTVDAANGTNVAFYAFRCTVPTGYQIRTNSPATLRTETLAHLFFEIS